MKIENVIVKTGDIIVFKNKKIGMFVQEYNNKPIILYPQLNLFFSR